MDRIDPNSVSWDDLRIFLFSFRVLSFRKAATALNISPSKVVRHIDRLEKSLDTKLFHRMPEGLTATREGMQLVSTVESMEGQSFELLAAAVGKFGKPEGRVRLAITEGLGTYWVLPQIEGFLRQNPAVTMDVHCDMNSVDVLRLEADVAIQLEQPRNPQLICARVATLHVCPFVSRDYLEKSGPLRDQSDLLNHRIVDQRMNDSHEGEWALNLGVDVARGITSVMANSSTAVYFAVAQGLGIGMLPTYASLLSNVIVPFEMGVNLRYDIWISYRPGDRSVNRVSATIDWVKDIFDEKKYPWFAKDFVHPNDFGDLQLDEWANVVRYG